MRLDKFLKVSRIIRRRTVAKAFCDADRVQVNGQVAKAGHEVSVGDRIAVQFSQGLKRFQVVAIREHVPAPEAASLYVEEADSP